MINWIKKKLGIKALEDKQRENSYFAALHVHEIQALKKRVSELEQILKETARTDADVGLRGRQRGNNTVILTGTYRGRGYVHFYDFGPRGFDRMVEQMRDMRKHSLIRTVDTPYITGDFKGYFGLDNG